MPARFPDTAVERNGRTQMNGNAASNRWNSDDEIVISGMSGRLPESDNIEEFKQQLFDGVDLVTEDNRRWTPGRLIQNFGRNSTSYCYPTSTKLILFSLH